MNGKETVNQNNFLTVPFSDVGYNTTDIQAIKLIGEGVGALTEAFSVWEGAPNIVEGSYFMYCDPTLDPTGEATECYWGDGETFEKVAFSIPAGQAVTIECAEGIEVSYAGQVVTAPVSFTSAEQNNFSGNPFAAEIDIQNVKIVGEGVGALTEAFSVWEGAPNIVEGSYFMYCDPTLDPTGEATECYWGDGETFEKVTYPLAPGKGFVIECAAGLAVTITPPYTLGE